MANCLLNSGTTFSCAPSAGINQIYIGAYNGNLMTFGATASGEIISVGGATVSFYPFAVQLETASYTEKKMRSIENGSYYVEGTTTFTIYSMSQENSNIVDAIGSGQWRVIILDVNGNYYIQGLVNGAFLTDGSGGLGKAFGDLIGSVLTLTSKEPNSLTTMSSTVALSLIV